MTPEISIVDIDGDGQTLRAVAVLLTDEHGGQVELARETYDRNRDKDNAIRTALELADVAASQAMTGPVTMPDGREISRRAIMEI